MTDYYDRCPKCGGIVRRGDPCKWCAQAATQTAPAPASATAVILMVLLILIGLFWIVVAILQLWLALGARAGSTGGLALVAVWNLVWGGATLGVVADVAKRRHRTLTQVTVLSVLGSVWGLVAGLWLGAWFQLLVVPLYITLGVLTWTNPGYFSEGRKSPEAAQRSFALAAPNSSIPRAQRRPWYSHRLGVGIGLAVIVIVVTTTAVLLSLDGSDRESLRYGTPTTIVQVINTPGVEIVVVRDVITLDHYQAIHAGDTYNEVMKIMPRPGVETASNDIAGVTTVMYEWVNPDGSNMNVMLQNNEVVSKAQFGLR